MLTIVASEQVVQSLRCCKSNSRSEENKIQPNCFRLAHVHVQMSLTAGSAVRGGEVPTLRWLLGKGDEKRPSDFEINLPRFMPL